MSYPRPIRARSIAEIARGKLHPWSPMYERPYDPYRQYSGVLRYHGQRLESSAEAQHRRAEAERKEMTSAEKKIEIQKIDNEIERMKRRRHEIERLETREIG